MDYASINSTEARQLIRSGTWKRPTTGLALGYVQANLVILPRPWAEEFATFCALNPGPAPLLDRTAPGNPHPMKVAPDADLRTDLPLYRIYREGKLVEEAEDIRPYWQEDFVAFLLGCSFSAERALLEHGIRLRHLEQGRNVSMYRTSIPCIPTPRIRGSLAPRIRGSLVVSMRPIELAMVDRVAEITGWYPLAHGAPVHIGDPAALGITDIAHPEWGDAVEVMDDDVLMFWACGVTSQAVIMEARPEIAITHSPGHMFITDWMDAAICQHTN